MKIVVIGGNRLIGRKLVNRLRASGNDAVAASPASGVDVLTGAGLAEVLKGAQVVVDVTNSPSFEDAAVLNFFQTSARNLLPAEAAAGVGHHVALSVVGADRLPESGYMRAKIAQEKAIKAATVPYTMDELARRFLSAKRDPREVSTDVNVRYYGTEVDDRSLTPGENPRIAPTRLEDWLSHS